MKIDKPTKVTVDLSQIGEDYVTDIVKLMSDSQELDTLIRQYPFFEICLGAVCNPNASSKTLSFIASSYSDVRILKPMLLHHNTSCDVLQEMTDLLTSLANESNMEEFERCFIPLFEAILVNPNTPVKTLETVLFDESFLLDNLPLEHLLIHHRKRYFRLFITGNSVEHIQQLIEPLCSFSRYTMRYAVLNCQHRKRLSELADIEIQRLKKLEIPEACQKIREDKTIIKWIANNKFTPSRTLDQLIEFADTIKSSELMHQLMNHSPNMSKKTWNKYHEKYCKNGIPWYCI